MVPQTYRDIFDSSAVVFLQRPVCNALYCFRDRPERPGDAESRDQDPSSVPGPQNAQGDEQGPGGRVSELRGRVPSGRQR